jgi:hypothetical protein
MIEDYLGVCMCVVMWSYDMYIRSSSCRGNREQRLIHTGLQFDIYDKNFMMSSHKFMKCR